ncbi:hypothetical protein GCM10010317_077500 [Streptomyces mirabilis]|uniref:hypothetical protein n=1 Tax=Streptomyces mirabilis TaxID=68239 RepID=UPI00167E3813|nr:hypothetical protein [Streptomyces mirabilis]GHD70351.1 hypothetical protein GCM10010317_077500 [Streptomyces mirabilis]
MNTEAITINGTETTLTAIGHMTWTASDINLRIRPNMTWRATRGNLAGAGSTAQEAADNLIATERKAEKAAKLAARSSKGQIFAREMRSYLRIGARTRRFDSKKWDVDGHRDVMQAIADANAFPGADAARDAIFQTAYAALCSWEKHIDGYRADAVLVSHINTMTPYQFVALIGDMVDADIANVGEGELFFADMARRLYAQAA